MKRPVVIVLSLMLGFLILLALGAQVIIPISAGELAAENPEFAHLAVPYSVAAVAVILCGQVVLAIVLRLLFLVDRGTIFTAPTTRLVNVIIWCLALATLITLAVALSFPPGPLFAFYALALAIVGAAATLIMVVLRSLLTAAIDYRGELDGVI